MHGDVSCTGSQSASGGASLLSPPLAGSDTTYPGDPDPQQAASPRQSAARAEIAEKGGRLMQRVTIRLSADLLRRLDAFAEARGLNGRSAAARAALREVVMAPDERDTPPDHGELLRLLGDSARDGSVTAMKALLEEHRRDSDSAAPSDGSVIDELARRRTFASAANGAPGL